MVNATKNKRPVLKTRPVKSSQPSTEPCPPPPAAPKARRLIRTKEVLHLCGGISRKTLWEWIGKGVYPKPLVINGQNFFDEDQHLAFVERHRPREVA